MKKTVSLLLLILIAALTACSREKQNEKVTMQNELNEESKAEETIENEEEKKENITDLWEQKNVNGEGNILEFRTGLQIVLPKEWKDKFVTYAEPAVQANGGTLVVCEKKNAEANGGGTLFILEYIMYDKNAIAPYEIFGKVLGVYNREEKIYALVYDLPRDLNYVEGNEEMKKAYEEVNALVDKVQIITENMEGFTECGIDDLDWIQKYGYNDSPESVEMLSYNNISFEMNYPAVWEVKEENGEDGGTVKFCDENGETVFWIEQGEAWRVNLDGSREDYKEILAESYQEVEIIELSKTEVNGYDAQKLIFTCSINGEKRTITKYILVSGYAFFDISYMDSIDIIPEENTGETIIDSIKFFEK